MFARVFDFAGILAAAVLAVVALRFGAGAGDGLPLGAAARAAQGFSSIAAVFAAAALCFAGALRYARVTRRHGIGLRVAGVVLLLLGAAVLFGVRSVY